MASASDPYKVLGISPEASEDQLRDTYRRVVRIHHPDHNQGSEESARRFEEIQEAYTRIRSLRAQRPEAEPPLPPADPALDDRLTDLEQQIRRAHAARERARRAAAEAAANKSQRPSDEELGYVKTEDSFGKVLADAEAELSQWLAGASERPAGKRVGDLIDELTGKLKGNRGP